MHCRYCGAEISELQERCGRCQRRLAAFPGAPSIPSAPPSSSPFVATAVVPAPDPHADLEAPLRFRVQEGGAPARPAAPIQPPLFAPEEKVVGLEEYLPHEPARRRPAVRRSRPASRPSALRQASFDFDALPADAHEFAAAQAHKPVASLARRAFAFLIDESIVMVGFAIFLSTVRAILGEWPAGFEFYAALALCLWIIASLYFFLHAAVGLRTPGQIAAGITIVTSDGRIGEPKHRVKRVLANALPVVSLMGAAWALITEEHFSFADLITGTYLTVAD